VEETTPEYIFDRLKTRPGEMKTLSMAVPGASSSSVFSVPSVAGMYFYRRDRKETQREFADTRNQIQECIYPQIWLIENTNCGVFLSPRRRVSAGEKPFSFADYSSIPIWHLPEKLFDFRGAGSLSLAMYDRLLDADIRYRTIKSDGGLQKAVHNIFENNTPG